VFLVQGPDPCISLYPASAYEELTRTALAGLNPLSAQTRAARDQALGRRAARAAPQIQLVLALVLVPAILLQVAADLLVTLAS
jgi:hypothetical protein